MAHTLIGVCQLCGRHIEFPAERSGQWEPCPHCHRSTRLKPAPVEILEAAPLSSGPMAAVVSEVPKENTPDKTSRRLRRSYFKLAVVAVILLGIMLGLVWFAEWLRSHHHQP